MKDYARVQRSQSNNAPPELKPAFRLKWTKTWSVIALSIFLVCVLAGIGYWRISHKTPVGAMVDKKAFKSKSKAKEAPKEPEILAKPQFEFYDILAERDSVAITRPSKPAVPQVTAQVAQPTQQIQPSPVPPAKKQYMIQVASYQDKPQAQKVVQRLRQAQIQARLILTSSGWWRIDVGPIETRRDAESIRHNIQTQGIVGSLIREISKS